MSIHSSKPVALAVSASMNTQKRLIRRFFQLFLLCVTVLLTLRAVAPDALLLQSPSLVNVWLTVHQDSVWLLIWGMLLVLITQLHKIPRLVAVIDRIRQWSLQQRHPVFWLTLFATLIPILGVDAVYHRFALCLDEFLLIWQAKVFLAGHLLAPIADGWADLTQALQPIFMGYDLTNGLWSPGYGPLSSAIYALFDLLNIGPWSNAILAGASVALTAAIARRAWPQEQQAPALAALLLATSPQLLITAMTPYAMTGHLFLNLLWLWLFLTDTRRGHVLAALVGLIACGLHQAYVHPLFIAPFMVSLLWQRRWRLAFGYAAWYAAALLLWIFWRDIATWWETGGVIGAAVDVGGQDFLARVMALIESFQIGQIAFVLMNLVRFLAWQNPLAVLLVIAALMGLSRTPYLVRMLLWSLLLTILTHAVLMPGQGHGWGYRYLHVHLGGLALVAVWGWLHIRETLSTTDREMLASMATVLVLAGVLVALPLRAIQTESFVRPFALADRRIKDLNTDLVFIDAHDVWFGVDLVRNDPLLRNAPKVITAQLTSAEVLQRVCPGKTAALIDYPALADLGMRQIPHPSIEREKNSRLLRQHLMDNGCRLLNTNIPPSTFQAISYDTFKSDVSSAPLNAMQSQNQSTKVHL